ncbi:MAG TPA: PsbP-related protein, partial [Lacunisphaera sp.]
MRLFLGAMMVALLAGPMASAKTVNLEGEGASITLPDTWDAKTQAAGNVTTSTSLILSAVNAEKNAMVQMMVCSNPNGMQVAQPELIANIKDTLSNQVLSHGGQIQFTDEGKLEINGVPAYVIQYKATMPTGPATLARSYQVAGNGKIYLMAMRTVDPMADIDLQTIAGSFKFDAPPALPVPKPPVHRLRYYLLAAAGVLVLIGLGVGYYFY